MEHTVHITYFNGLVKGVGDWTLGLLTPRNNTHSELRGSSWIIQRILCRSLNDTRAKQVCVARELAHGSFAVACRGNVPAVYHELAPSAVACSIAGRRRTTPMMIGHISCVTICLPDGKFRSAFRGNKHHPYTGTCNLLEPPKSSPLSSKPAVKPLTTGLALPPLCGCDSGAELSTGTRGSAIALHRRSFWGWSGSLLLHRSQRYRSQ